MSSSATTRIRARRKLPAQPPFPLFENRKDESFESGLQGVTQLLQGRKNIVVITGAGISVSSGIPDFRSKDIGIYETLDMEELGLSCPEDLFDSHFFQEDPRPFYKFAKSLYFPNHNSNCSDSAKDRQRNRARPSDSHKLLALLDQQKRLLRCYTQNIDGLEQEAGVSAKKIVYAHGSLEWATCLGCKRKVERSEMEEDVLKGRVARCRAILPDSSSSSSEKTTSTRPVARPSRKRSNPDHPLIDDRICTRGVTRIARTCNGVLKPGITFFGETLGENVRRALEMDHDKVDALLVIGTSLSVAPISKVIRYLPADIPRILINRSIVHPPLADMLMVDDPDDQEEEKDFREGYVFDAYLLGFCDDIIRVLVRSLFSNETGDASDCAPSSTTDGELLAVITSIQDDTECGIYSVRDWQNVQIPHNRVFLFPGALAPKCCGSDNASVLSYREVAHCDGCAQRIEGTIRKCLSCFDFDLCTKCYPTLYKKHFKGKHVFATEAAAPPFSTVAADPVYEARFGKLV